LKISYIRILSIELNIDLFIINFKIYFLKYKKISHATAYYNLDVRYIKI